MTPFNSLLCLVFVFEFGYKAYSYQHANQQKRLEKWGASYATHYPEIYKTFEQENGAELLD